MVVLTCARKMALRARFHHHGLTECEHSPQAERAFRILHPIKVLLTDKSRHLSAHASASGTTVYPSSMPFYALLPVFWSGKSVVKSRAFQCVLIFALDAATFPPYTPRHRTSNGELRLQGTSCYLSTIVLGGRTAGKRMRSCFAWDRAEKRKCQTNIVGGRADS
jgi:hypothetical protein